MKTKVTVIEIKDYQLKKYLNKIRLNLKNINSLQKSGTWKIQSRIAINFISSEDNGEEHVMASKGDNIKIMINDEIPEVIKEHFKSLKKDRYRNNLELMKGSELFFEYVHLLY